MKAFCTIIAILGLVSVKTVSGSWQSYVDDQLIGTGQVAKAAIINLDGNALASTPISFLKSGEGNTIVSLYTSPGDVFAKGITVGGIKYTGIKANNRSIYGKKGATGVVLVKTDQSILIGVYDERQQPGNAVSVVERLADYLIDNGY